MSPLLNVPQNPVFELLKVKIKHCLSSYALGDILLTYSSHTYTFAFQILTSQNNCFSVRLLQHCMAMKARECISFSNLYCFWQFGWIEIVKCLLTKGIILLSY